MRNPYPTLATMTSRVLSLALLLSVVLWTGCLPSLNPIYTEKELVFEEGLLGDWSDPDKPDEVTKFERGEGKAYKMTFTDKNGPTIFDAHLVRLGDSLFMNMAPNQEALKEKVPENYRGYLLPAHYFFRVQLNGSKLHLHMLNGDAIKEHARKLGVQERPNGGDCMTASTADLQSFLKE